MSTPVSLQERVDDYLAERRRLGFALHSWDSLLADFASFVAGRHHDGPLTVELMVAWVQQAEGGQGTRKTWYRRMAKLRLFLRYLQQFEPQTEIPEDTLYGPEPGRVVPHIYRKEEVVELLAAARALGPHGGLRAATFETLFGLMAATGQRVSEAIRLRGADVDLKRRMLIVRESKFAKSRQLPLHPSTVEALARFRQRRRRRIPMTPEMPFFTGTCGKRLGQPLGDRQVHRIFKQLREYLHWVNRGAHAAPRLHDLRHNSASRIIPSPWLASSTDGGSRARWQISLGTNFAMGLGKLSISPTTGPLGRRNAARELAETRLGKRSLLTTASIP